MALTADSFKCNVKKITPDTSGVHHSTVLTLVKVWNAVSNGLFYSKSLIFQVLPCLIQKFLWFLGTCRCFEDDFKIKILNFMIQMENPWNPIPWRVGDKVWQSGTMFDNPGQGLTIQDKETQIATCSWKIWFKH